MEVILKGAELLTRYYSGSENWKRGIDVQNLDIADNADCILGQLFGNCVNGANLVEAKLNLPNRFYNWFYNDGYWPEDYGFAISSQHPSWELNAAWRKYLSQ